MDRLYTSPPLKKKTFFARIIFSSFKVSPMAHFNAGRRHENSRVRVAVRHAVELHGGKLSTGDAARIAYPHIFKAGEPLPKNSYHYVREALKEVCVCVGVTDEIPGRPLYWERRQ
jgi:hypothetical protein